MKTLSPILLLFAVVAAQVPWDTAAPLPQARYSAGAVGIGHTGYVLGGSVTGGVKSKTMFIYHQQGDSWSVGDSMLLARHRFGAAAGTNAIFVCGGWDAAGALMNRCERYNLTNRTWSPIETMPTRRAGLVAACVTGRLYAIGGWTGTQALATNEEFDPATGHWTTKRPMPTARTEAVVGVHAGRIYVIGGLLDASNVTGVVEVYDPVGDSWFTRQPMPTPRAAAASGTSGGKICIYGGMVAGGRNTHVTECYWPVPNQWYAMESLPTSRRYAAGFALNLEIVYAIGGQDSLGQPMTMVECLPLPMGLSAGPGTRLKPAARTFFRPGELVRSPFGEQRISARVYDCAGNLRAELAGAGSFACPRLASGVYLVSWLSGSAEAVTRLLVLSD